MRVIRVHEPGAHESGQQLLLGKRAKHYLLHVLRVRMGQEIQVFDGSGREYMAVINHIFRSDVSVKIGAPLASEGESSLVTELALGLSKGDRFDWAIQKATELGVTKIVPLITERVDFRVPADRLGKRMEHWRQILIGACEQSQRTLVPSLSFPTHLESWLQDTQADRKFVLCTGKCDPEPGNHVSSVSLLIGPEGGLNASEINLAKKKGFLSLQLGPRTLRTETAPIVALTFVGLRYGDLSRHA